MLGAQASSPARSHRITKIGNRRRGRLRSQQTERPCSSERGRYDMQRMKKRYWIAGTATAAATLAVTAKLLLRPRDADWSKNRHVVFHSDHSRFIEIDGVRMHYQEAGAPTSPALVLIHGFASSTLVWSKVFLDLAAAGFRVIALDMLGYGYSGKPRHGEYTIAGQARLVTQLLDSLRIKRAHIVGSSYGGAVAATCGLDYTNCVGKLLLVVLVNNTSRLE